MKRLLFLLLLVASPVWLGGCVEKEVTPSNYVEADADVHFSDGSIHWYRYATGEEKIFVWHGKEDIPSEVYDCKKGVWVR